MTPLVICSKQKSRQLLDLFRAKNCLHMRSTLSLSTVMGFCGIKTVANGILPRIYEIKIGLMILLVLDRLIEYIPVTTAIAITWTTIAMRITTRYILINIIMVMCQHPNVFQKIWHKDHTNEHRHPILILRVMHIVKDCSLSMYINTKIITMTATVTSEVGFFDAVCGDPLLLSLLSVSTMAMLAKIVSVFVNIDVFTLKFDEGNNMLIIRNNFARDNDMIHYAKREQKKESKTSQCVAVLGNFFLVLSIIYVIMDVADGRLFSVAILMVIYLFSRLIAVLAIFDEFNPIECDTRINYYVYVVFFFFHKNFYFFCLQVR